ncbi:DNA repair helicase [Rhizophagus irregularis]|uniref:ATP-dependent DNA helicase CHL1 n=1 Tax=Rhizophagus irregularis TaxID=588596 RepID=A0A2N0PX67_9GLOM|nr:DNA repair helicase [Rhizophagus irregularis]
MVILDVKQITEQNNSVLLPPTDITAYNFPFQPYNIQVEFMKSLYQVIEKGKVGIFESPTGTGKSLSIICGALKWLKDNEERYSSSNHVNTTWTGNPNEPSWVLEYSKNKKRQEDLVRKQELNKRIQMIRKKEKLERQKATYRTVGGNVIQKRLKKDHSNGLGLKIDKRDYDMEEYLVEEYQSDDDSENHEENDNMSAQVRELLKRFQEGKSLENFDDNKDAREFEEGEPDEIKIYYCSRTHSQLTQFVNELRKTVYAEDVKCVSLGSRKNLCINEEVRKLKNINRINERCLDMQKAGKKPEKRCPYIPIRDKSRMLDYRDHVLASVRDIEELVDIGRKLNACSYYGTRKSIRQCQIVILPYNLLLQKSSRESMGISLKNNIVIIDEAHNLVDTVTSVHTVQIDLPQIVKVHSQLNAYLDRYKKRLLGKNIMYIQQILSLLDALIKCLTSFEKKCEEKGKDKEEIYYIKSVNDFLHLLKSGDLNLFKIENYLKKSQIARKLNGFIDKIESRTGVEIHQAQQTSYEKNSSTLPSLSQIEAFFMSLTNGNQDGRVILGFQQISVSVEGKRGGTTTKYVPIIKYLLLNPSNQFKDIVEDARSVILAGGTMEPTDDLIGQLIPYLPPQRLSKFSCGHIIPPENLLTLTLSEGPMGGTLEFTFERRGDIKLIDELGQTIVNLCNIIPDGVVCFFTSYAYLEQVYKRWEQNGILERIRKYKMIFREPRETRLVDKVLNEYDLHIHSSNNKDGAILLCVVGGKVSEGINFSDRLGRGVIMIGLPFANLTSVGLSEKMKFMNQIGESSAGEKSSNPSQHGKEYYQNLCMKAVNQSIGRAIRHQKDYATIILIDKRFNTNNQIRQKLPKWIKQNVTECRKFGQIVGKVAGFFKNKKDILT